MNIFTQNSINKKTSTNCSYSVVTFSVNLCIWQSLVSTWEHTWNRSFLCLPFIRLAYQFFYSTISIISNCVCANALSCLCHSIVLYLSAPAVTTYFVLTLINWISSSMWFEKVRIRKSKCFWKRKCFVHTYYSELCTFNTHTHIFALKNCWYKSILVASLQWFLYLHFSIVAIERRR